MVHLVMQSRTNGASSVACTFLIVRTNLRSVPNLLKKEIQW